MTPAPHPLLAVLFDLDGVIVSTDQLHFRAWKRLANEEGIPFNQHDNERLRGVSRMESLEILLEKAATPYSDAQKEAMAERKNNFYRESLKSLSPADILPGVLDVLKHLRHRGIRVAIGSSSKNAGPILQAIGLENAFDVVVDGTHIYRSKPDPEVFLLAAKRLDVAPANCLVVEDADAGIEAALAAGMPVLAVGSAASHPKATFRAPDLASTEIAGLL